jgi:hypothetical protein
VGLSVGTASNDAADVNSLFCGQCGAQIPPDSIFCPMCGFRTELARAEPAPPVPPDHSQPGGIQSGGVQPSGAQPGAAGIEPGAAGIEPGAAGIEPGGAQPGGAGIEPGGAQPVLRASPEPTRTASADPASLAAQPGGGDPVVPLIQAKRPASVAPAAPAFVAQPAGAAPSLEPPIPTGPPAAPAIPPQPPAVIATVGSTEPPASRWPPAAAGPAPLAPPAADVERAASRTLRFAPPSAATAPIHPARADHAPSTPAPPTAQPPPQTMRFGPPPGVVSPRLPHPSPHPASHAPHPASHAPHPASHAPHRTERLEPPHFGAAPAWPSDAYDPEPTDPDAPMPAAAWAASDAAPPFGPSELPGHFAPQPGPGLVPVTPVQPPTTRPLPYHRQPSIPPAAAATIPPTPRPVRIVLGSLFLLVTLWLVLFFLPRHKPLSAAAEAELAARAGQAEVLRQRELRLSEEVHVGGNVGAVALALAGIGLILSGALHRPQAHVRCRRCLRPVLAWKGPFGLHCPFGDHYAQVQWILVALTALFWTGLLILAAIIVLWLA